MRQMALKKQLFDSKRTNLREVIPLTAPFYVGIEPTRMCNLKCFFCQHSTRGTDCDRFAQKYQKIKHIDMKLFDKIVRDIFKFPAFPKRISLMGMGEPTLNPNLCAMVRQLREAGFDGRISTYTNGTTLTKDLASELAGCGLTNLQISIYGLNMDDYLRFTGIAVDTAQLIENIRCLYEHKGGLDIRIKTTDDVADSEAKRQMFYSTFEGICDQISIEHIINIPVQMGKPLTLDRNITQFGTPVTQRRDVCPWMFYQMHVNSDGDVFCCDILAKPRDYAVGNIAENPLPAIWNGEARTALLKQSLRSGHESIEQCRDCDDIYSINQPEEFLDDCRENLLARLSLR
jgi:radical SAM protein with 4Fe4S-binding SPASM domain